MARKSDLEKRLERIDDLKARGKLTDNEYEAARQQAINNPPTVTISDRPSFLKIGCLAIVGIVVLLVVIAAIGAAVNGSNDDAATAERNVGSSSPAVGTNSGDVHVALSVQSSGQIAPDGNGKKRSKVTILQLAPSVESSNQFVSPPDGKKWVGFEVLVENVGSQEVTSLDWKLRDSKDLEHNQAFVIGAGTALEVFYNLTPGGKSRGWLYFEIDSDASVKWLRADPNPFLKNDLYFDAQ